MIGKRQRDESNGGDSKRHAPENKSTNTYK